jgi:transcriptional regulator with XRE-family HTH domain
LQKRKEMNTYIKDYLNKYSITQKELAQRLGVKQATVSATISRPSFPTLERIAAALEVEPWQLLAPPAVVEELKQARAQRSAGGGGLVGVVRVGCEIYTADTVQQLRAIVERLERDEGAKK